jgi:hypothetical protein
VLGLGLLLLAGQPGLVAGLAAEDVRLDLPSASGEFGEIRVFETGFTASEPPLRVELLSTLPGVETRAVSEATLERTGQVTELAAAQLRRQVCLEKADEALLEAPRILRPTSTRCFRSASEELHPG